MNQPILSNPRVPLLACPAVPPRRLVAAMVVLLVCCSAASGQSSLDKRLAQLDPSDALQYKLLAEEFAARSGDTEARVTALRLFHAAAWLDPERLGKGSLRSMIALARTPDEEQRFRAALYLLDPAAEADSLPRVAATPARTGGDPPAELVQALRQLRQTGRDAARPLLGTQAVRDFLAAEANRPLREQLQPLFSANRLSDAQLRQVLELELAWTRDPSRSSSSMPQAASPQPWSELGRDAIKSTPRSVTLLDLTEFDPRKQPGGSKQ